MKFSSLHNIISIHPYEVVSGKVPSKANLQAFFKEKQFPQRVNGWRFGFMDVDDRIKYRSATNFFAEVVTNLSGVKILRDEVKKMSVPQKHLEMIAAAFHKNGILENEKYRLLQHVAGLNQDKEKIKQELEKKYGSIDIDLQSGSFTVIEDKVVEEK